MLWFFCGFGFCSCLYFLKLDFGVRVVFNWVGVLVMVLCKELFKFIWYVFIVLDVEKSGKVFKF